VLGLQECNRGSQRQTYRKAQPETQHRDIGAPDVLTCPMCVATACHLVITFKQSQADTQGHLQGLPNVLLGHV
jgi:hypothetical protein